MKNKKILFIISSLLLITGCAFNSAKVNLESVSETEEHIHGTSDHEFSLEEVAANNIEMTKNLNDAIALLKENMNDSPDKDLSKAQAFLNDKATRIDEINSIDMYSLSMDELNDINSEILDYISEIRSIRDEINGY